MQRGGGHWVACTRERREIEKAIVVKRELEMERGRKRERERENERDKETNSENVHA